MACQVCGKEFEVIAPKHLTTHGMTSVEYRTAYPDTPMMGSGSRKTRGKGGLSHGLHKTYVGNPPDKRLFSFLVGTMLGDGSLEHMGANARYTEGGSNKEYEQFKYELLTAYFPASIQERLSAKDKRTGKRYRGWWVRTGVHPLLTEWRQAWYDGWKRVCRELVERHLDDFALAIWFFDDGHLGEHNAMLYPMAFTRDDAEFLSSLLTERFDIENKVVVNKKQHPLIRISSNGRNKLLEVIRPHTAPGMEYKTRG